MSRETAAVPAGAAKAFASAAATRARDAACEPSRAAGMAAPDEAAVRFDERMSEARRAAERELAHLRAEPEHAPEARRDENGHETRTHETRTREARTHDGDRTAERGANARREAEHASRRREAARAAAQPDAGHYDAADAQPTVSHENGDAGSAGRARSGAGATSPREQAAKPSRCTNDAAQARSGAAANDGAPACPAGSDASAAAESPRAGDSSPTDARVAPAGSAASDVSTAAEVTAAACAIATDTPASAPHATRAGGVRGSAPGVPPPIGERPGRTARGSAQATPATEVAAPDAAASTRTVGKSAPRDDAAQPAAGTGISADAARNGRDFTAQLARAASGDAGTIGAATALVAQANTTSGTTPAGATAVPFHTAAVSTPVGQPAFAERFAAEVTVLASAGIERAQIQVQPPDLGPVHIDLALDGEHARIAFSAAQPLTRHAIEQSLPVLRDMLAAGGLVLADANVSDGRQAFAGGGGAFGAAHTNRSGRAPAAIGATAVAGRAAAVIAPRSLLDVYA